MSLNVEAAVRRGDTEIAPEFTIDEGTTVALLGPNGAGKSTVVSMLAGLLAPTRGTVSLDGTTLDDARAGVHVPPAHRPIGVVFQDLLLFPHLSAAENVAFPLRARGVSRRRALARAAELLGRLGIEEKADEPPSRLSGGEAQRVAIARALAGEPRVLLLDEPLAAADAGARSSLRATIAESLRSFPGLRLLVTHDPIEAMTLADRVVLLEEGRVTQTGTPGDVRETPRTGYAARLVGVNLFSGRLERIEPGVGRLSTPDGPLTVPWPADALTTVEGAIGLLQPSDVTLHLARPEGSARNVLEGRVTAVMHQGSNARIQIATSPPLIAELTAGSVSRLGIERGTAVWASFKAVEVRIVT